MNDHANTFLKWMTGGLLAGGGISSLYHFAKDLGRIRRESRSGEHSADDDDDTLYLKVRTPRTKTAGDGLPHVTVDPDSAVHNLLKVLGATAGAVGGYAGIKNLYQNVRKSQLQDELDAAQNAYIGVLHQKKEKETPKYASTGSTVGGAGLALLAALGIGSFITADRVLDKYLPRPKKPVKSDLKDVIPSKIVLDRAGNKNDKVLYNENDDVEAAADEIENMIRTAAAAPDVAGPSGLGDLISGIADGRLGEVKSATATYGVDHAFTIVKGASAKEVDFVAKEIAIGILARDELLKSAFVPLVASEIINMSPSMHAMTKHMDPMDKLAARVETCIRTVEYRGNVLSPHADNFEKSATTLSKNLPLAVVLGKLLESDIPQKPSESSSFYFKGEDSDSKDENNPTEEDVFNKKDNDELDAIFRARNSKLPV
jgi:hypothetical protein